MSQILRSWLAFAAIGAAVIHLALVVSSPLPIAIPLTAIGVAEAGWAVATLSRGRLVLPRAAVAGALGPLVAWALLLVAAMVFGNGAIASLLAFVPMAVAALFELFIASVISVHVRRASERHGDIVPEPRRGGNASLYLLGMFAGAMIVAGLTTPALAYTQAGHDGPHAGHHGGTADDTFQVHAPGHFGH